MNLLVLGAGFTGSRIALAARSAMAVCGTRRTPEGCAALAAQGVAALEFSSPTPALASALRRCTHLVVSVPPARTEPLHDAGLQAVQAVLADDPRALPDLQWIGYLSTIGVYGDHQGAWVDETSECRSSQVRSRMRLAAELGWQDLSSRLAVPIAILRLSGIYGPGRNAVADALAHKARRLIKPGQVFNRIHVDDIVSATLLAMQTSSAGIYNVTDDCPAAPQSVVEFAHALIGRPPPPAIDFATADLSPMARSFYSENKRVRNVRSREVLGLHYAWPDYETGLRGLLAAELEAARIHGLQPGQPATVPTEKASRPASHAGRTGSA